MELNETQDKKEKLSQEIAKILPIIQQFISKPIDDMTEMDYIQLKSFRDNCKDINGEISELIDKKNEMKSKIEYIEHSKIIAPLVPIEDFSGGLTEEGFEKFKFEYKDLDAFLKSEDINQVSVVYKNLETVILNYEERIKEEQDREQKRIEEEQNRLKEEQDREKIDKKIKEIKSFISTPETPKCIKATAMHPVSEKNKNFYYNIEDDVIQSVRYFDGKVKYVSDKIRQMYEKGYITTEFLDDIHYATEIISSTHFHNCSEDQHIDHKSYIKFTPYEKCDIRQMQACKEAEKQLEKIINSEDEKYDEPGTISLKVFIEDYGEKIIKVDITQRELAIGGVLPEDFKWKAKSKVSSMDIAKEDKRQALTTTEVGGIRGFITRLLDRFKGKGEK